MPSTRTARKRNAKKASGRLRIGDDWNAINIIALSQTNPLKAVAELVENSIDASARHVTITRGREQGETYVRIRDDGDGIPADEEGKPNFRYVATHICDSIKRQLKADGARRIQGDFGIGLLSFWTVGENLTMTTAGTDGKTYQMHMRKGSPSYTLNAKRTLLFPDTGTELTIKPLLPGVRQLNGDEMQWYLASELRDRIRNSGVQVKIVDRTARKEYKVEPRQFSGRLLHELPAAEAATGQKQFFDYAGPLFSVRVSPQSSVVPVGESRTYPVVALRRGAERDRHQQRPPRLRVRLPQSRVEAAHICRLFAKEMVQKNFPGYSPDELLERMIELSLYTEEKLR